MSQTVIKLQFTPVSITWSARVRQVWSTLRMQWQDAATQRQLATLDDRALSDIGISRAQAQFVAELPAWKFHR